MNKKNFDNLSDKDLAVLNAMLPWMCFTQDSKNRKLGKQAWEGKRSTNQEIPDLRIIQLNNLVDLCNKKILEVGCFEGVHTTGLMHYSENVYAVDVRIENVIKTLARCTAYNIFPKVFMINVENDEYLNSLEEFEILHHVGVLYHLFDPVNHLNIILKKIKNAILLDTHYSTIESSTHVDHSGYVYKEYQELGYYDVFSGINKSSKWLTKMHILELLKNNGFKTIDILSDRLERNGDRITLVAKK